MRSSLDRNESELVFLNFLFSKLRSSEYWCHVLTQFLGEDASLPLPLYFPRHFQGACMYTVEIIGLLICTHMPLLAKFHSLRMLSSKL